MAGGKHRIQIHAGQVKKILLIATGYRVERFVSKGHSVQEGVHRALEQLGKWFLDRVLIQDT